MQVDADNSGEIEFSEFVQVIVKHKASTTKDQDEADTLDAFVALGGNVSVHAGQQQPAGTVKMFHQSPTQARPTCHD